MKYISPSPTTFELLYYHWSETAPTQAGLLVVLLKILYQILSQKLQIFSNAAILTPQSEKKIKNFSYPDYFLMK